MIVGEVRVDARLLSGWLLPTPGDDDDKAARGVVLVVGGSAETPGAVLLAGVAALRAGAGKLRLATAASTAAALGVAVPEALVAALPEDGDGAVDASAAAQLTELAGSADVVVIGPGIASGPTTAALLASWLPSVEGGAVVLDAGAISCLDGADDPALRGLAGRGVVTPNPGEMAALLGREREEVLDDASSAVRHVADHLDAVVSLRAARTWTACAGGAVHVDDSGTVGLATSGSGDVLAGLLGGLLATGADHLQAAVWAGALHGRAGERLSGRLGRVGLLARELVDEIPAARRDLERTGEDDAEVPE